MKIMHAMNLISPCITHQSIYLQTIINAITGIISAINTSRKCNITVSKVTSSQHYIVQIKCNIVIARECK